MTGTMTVLAGNRITESFDTDDAASIEKVQAIWDREITQKRGNAFDPQSREMMSTFDPASAPDVVIVPQYQGG